MKHYIYFCLVLAGIVLLLACTKEHPTQRPDVSAPLFSQSEYGALSFETDVTPVYPYDPNLERYDGNEGIQRSESRIITTSNADLSTFGGEGTVNLNTIKFPAVTFNSKKEYVSEDTIKNQFPDKIEHFGGSIKIYRNEKSYSLSPDDHQQEALDSIAAARQQREKYEPVEVDLTVMSKSELKEHFDSRGYTVNDLGNDELEVITTTTPILNNVSIEIGLIYNVKDHRITESWIKDGGKKVYQQYTKQINSNTVETTADIYDKKNPDFHFEAVQTSERY